MSHSNPCRKDFGSHNCVRRFREDSSRRGDRGALIQANGFLRPAFAGGGQPMIGTRAVPLLLCAVIATSTDALAASKYAITQDPQAVAVAQAAFAAMGGAQAIAGYQDSQATGIVTLSPGGNPPVSYPITMKSKGLRETRVELQMPKGTNVRIVNQSQGAILRPDGSVKKLYSNNTFYEHIDHVPLLSVLAEFANANV